MKNVLLFLLALCRCSYSTEIPLSPLVIGHMKLYESTTKKIIQKTIVAKTTVGQCIGLSLVCKSWQALCQDDEFIINYLSKSKEYNQNLLQQINDPWNDHIFGTEYIEEIVTYHWFDVRYQSPPPNSYSVLEYAIQKKYYSLFEKLLTDPHIIIRPIILETIINNPNITFFNILKKYPLNFGHYHFACQYSTYVFDNKEVSSPIPIVTYAKKKKSAKKGEKSFLWLMKKKVADNALTEQRNQYCLNKNKSVYPMFFSN